MKPLSQAPIQRLALQVSDLSGGDSRLDPNDGANVSWPLFCTGPCLCFTEEN